MLGSLTSVIDQDAALSCNLESYKTWSEGAGKNAALDEITDKCESAKVEVSDHTFMLWKWQNMMELSSPSSLVSPL